MRRMAELKEQRARAQVLQAQSFLEERKEARQKLIEGMVEREAAFLDDQPFISGAIFGMLSQTREMGEQQVKEIEARMVEIEGVLETRRQEHYVFLRKQEGARELEATMRREWRKAREKHESLELEDITSASRWVRKCQESDSASEPTSEI